MTTTSKLKAVPAPVAPVTVTESTAPASCATWADLRKALVGMFAERADVIDVTLAAFLAREHVFYLGPAGTGKSALARAIAEAFGKSYFEHLLTKFTTPNEIFGDVNLPVWQATGKYTRETEGYAPEAAVWFLDEVWKGSSAILNALLTALNERRFRNGGRIVSLPLLTVVAASNELPEGEGLDPIYDRFLVRCEVLPIVEDDPWVAMVESPDPVAPTCTLDLAKEQAACAAVKVPHEVVLAERVIANELRKAGHVISDRRWKRCLKLVQARAYLDGRTVAEPDDLDVLEHVLWREPKQRAAIAGIIAKHTTPGGTVIVERLDEARDLYRSLSADAKAGKRAALGELGSCSDGLEKILGDLDALPDGRKLRAARAEVQSLVEQTTALVSRSFGTKLT